MSPGLVEKRIKKEDCSNNQRLPQLLLERIFCVNNGKLDWQPEIKENIGPFGENFHVALYSLWAMYSDDEKRLVETEPLEFKLTGRAFESRHPEFSCFLTHEASMKANYGELVEIIMSDKTKDGKKVQGLIQEVFEKPEGGKILVTGCSTALSASSLITTLNKYGFKEEIHFTDISAGVLALIDTYKEFFNWEEKYGISIQTERVDLTNLPSEFLDNKYDIILSDTIGNYLSYEDLKETFSKLAWHVLNSKGLFLIRDMGEIEETPSTEKAVGEKNPTSQISENEKEFLLYLVENFQVNISEEDFLDTKKNAWNIKRDRELRPHMRQMYSSFLEVIPGCEIIFHTLHTSKGQQQRREFSTMVFKKSRENNNPN